MNPENLLGGVTSTESSKLIDLLRIDLGSNEEIHKIDPSKIKYALYARKSTEDEDRQVRSIEDQIKDCFDLIIKPLNIKFDFKIDIFKEQKSAKESGNRPEYRRMIKAIEAGEYNGLISWHYDRIARNMKEAGEIIDMVDKGILKDLRLAKSNF